MSRAKGSFPAIQPRRDSDILTHEVAVSPGAERAAIIVANVILACKFILKLWLFAVAALFVVANLACMGASDAGHDEWR